MNQSIGENAGKVWQYLIDNGRNFICCLEKDLDLKSDVAALSLGWLAREGKLEMTKRVRLLKLNI